MFQKFKFAAGIAAAALCPVVGQAPAYAETPAETAQLFGAREGVGHVSLSPDGSRFSYIAPYGAQGEALYLVDLTQAAPTPQRVIALTVERSNLDFCEFATNTRFVCRTSFTRDSNVSGDIFGYSRIFAVDADGENIEQLSPDVGSRSLYVGFSGGSVVALDVEGEPDKILMTQDWFPENGANTRLANKEWGRGVVEVDIDSGRTRKVESPDGNAFAYYADETGAVRLKGVGQFVQGRDSGERAYFYRRQGSSKWEELSRATVGAQTLDEGFVPVAVAARENAVYGIEPNGNGNLAIYRQKLDGSNTREEVVSRRDVDVDDLIRLGRQRRVVGASYATEVRQAVYFDPELKALAEGLEAALPGSPLIGIRGANADESKLLVSASSDTDPGMLYLYDKQTRQLNELMPLRDGFAGRELGSMRPVSYPAADGTQIPGYLTLPPGQEDATGLPAIVMPHGGPGSRDEWGFDWLAQFFAARGYAVLQPNFRGSAGYGSEWFGRNGFQAWRTAVGDVNDAGRWLVSEGVADPAKLAIVGWSYGGYAALQSQVLDPSLYKAIAAIAPVTDLKMWRNEFQTSANLRLIDDFVGDGPHVTQGSPARNVSAFVSPVLLVHGDADQNVGVSHSREMESELRNAGKDVRFIEFENVAHSINDSGKRVRMLTEIDAFLTRNLAP